MPRDVTAADSRRGSAAGAAEHPAPDETRLVRPAGHLVHAAVLVGATATCRAVLGDGLLRLGLLRLGQFRLGLPGLGLLRLGLLGLELLVGTGGVLLVAHRKAS
ncbi:putative membrane protein [Saccharothrix espanaensis DSM 44229]|uniref:Putative membrane protein n=1 Tax=Saccharothrix espanaensis (strain ATCC 51144 / DSM 44229 / JCM 9112 / NBRC 15066 / NRRL 15764) TaxID=1179773 RepID=K0JXV9_SACES|nr:putative membrane protein [Saccharothrix espanaensis DSM 44229]